MVFESTHKDLFIPSTAGISFTHNTHFAGNLKHVATGNEEESGLSANGIALFMKRAIEWKCSYGSSYGCEK